MIPPFQELMLPIMKLAKTKREASTPNREFIDRMAEEFRLSEKDRKELLVSGTQSRFGNRVYWALVHLRRAGVLESTGRGMNRITARGHDLLSKNPSRIDLRVLNQFPEFLEFRVGKVQDTPGETVTEAADVSPEETLDEEYQTLRKALAAQLAERLRECSPTFFEQLVVDLLLKVGYGGSRAEAGRATRATADGGVDGVINEDRLGLDAVFVQAKRWENSVGEPQLRDFVGALHAHWARKGVFMTTSNFSDSARRYIEKVDFKISLIDGRKLAELMIDFGVGVSLAHTYEIKKVDSDYFDETWSLFV
jgi:restriction system protein